MTAAPPDDPALYRRLFELSEDALRERLTVRVRFVADPPVLLPVTTAARHGAVALFTGTVCDRLTLGTGRDRVGSDVGLRTLAGWDLLFDGRPVRAATTPLGCVPAGQDVYLVLDLTPDPPGAA